MKHSILFSLALLFSSASQALDVKLTPYKDFIEVIDQGNLIKVQRVQDQDHVLKGGFSKTSRKCPPFCIQPMIVAEGVTTVGQLELFTFMEQDLLDETGVIVDARTPSWYKRGTIPGSVNIPFTVFDLSADDPQLVSALRSLGVKRRGNVGDFERSIEQMGFMGGDLKNDIWDFTAAKKLILWCNGSWCGQSPLAIGGLIKMGYPTDKLFYYRGGMQAWQSLGLTVIIP